MRPIYHRTEPRVRAPIFMAALALLVERALENQLKEWASNLWTAEALESLLTVQAVEFQLEGHGTRLGVSVGSPRARQIMAALGSTAIRSPCANAPAAPLQCPTDFSTASATPNLDGCVKTGLVAFTPNGTPLRTLYAELWTRESEPSKAQDRKQLPFEEKESPRWLQTHKHAQDITQQYPETKIFGIADSTKASTTAPRPRCNTSAVVLARDEANLTGAWELPNSPIPMKDREGTPPCNIVALAKKYSREKRGSKRGFEETRSPYWRAAVKIVGGNDPWQAAS